MGKRGAPLGNTNATKNKPVLDELRKHAVQEEWQSLRDGVAEVWKAVAKGEQWAIFFVRDMLDGKLKETSEITVIHESFTDSEARVMAEALIESARSSDSVGAE